MARQRNVQQQNSLTLETMLATARGARRGDLPVAAARFLAAKGMDAAACTFVFIETAGYMLSLEHGILAFFVTPGDRIYTMELELDASLEQVLQAIEFCDVTEAQDLSRHNPGTGWGWGALALEVRRVLDEADGSRSVVGR